MAIEPEETEAEANADTSEYGGLEVIEYEKGTEPPRAVDIAEVEKGASLTDVVLLAVRQRRWMQDRDEGNFRDYADGTCGGGKYGSTSQTDKAAVLVAKQALVDAKKGVRLTWRHQLDLAVALLYAESDPRKMRRLLVDVAAMSVAWVEGLEVRAADRRIAEQQNARKLVLLPNGQQRLVHLAPWWRRLWRWMRRE